MTRDRGGPVGVRALGVALAEGFLAALVAAVVVATWEAVAIGGSEQASFGGIALAVLGLYAIPALLAAAGGALVVWAWRAEVGPRALSRAWRALQNDPELERRAVGAVFAAGAAALVVAAVAWLGALKLVAGVERQGTGALLLGVVAAASLLVAAAAALPAYRLGAAVARLVPRLGPVPRPVLLLAAALVAAIAAGLVVVTTRLDWRALPLGAALAALLLAAALAAAWLGAARLSRRVDGVVVAGAGAGAALLLLGVAFLASGTSLHVARRVSARGRGAPALVALERAFSDGDGDGFSAFFAGPDCDDTNPNVHPGAEEIAGNGIDDNCLGGDRAADATPVAKAAPGTPAKTAPADRPVPKNLLFIAVDTLRADRLGVAGYRRDGKSLTPRIDALAAKSTYFTKVWSQAPNTPRSFPSIFTSRFPSQVAVDKSFKNYPTVSGENLTIFEALAAAGIHTAGFASHFYFKAGRGIQQGFAEWHNDGALDIAGSNKDIAAPRIVPAAVARLKELAAGGDRFALFVHLFEPHSSYMVHPGHPITEHGVAGLMQKYDYEIAFVDEWVGKLLDGLEASGVADQTLVVLVSDHGEAFGVHRVAGKKMFFHGQTLYDELLRVPLIIHAPGAEPRKIDDASMLLDVAPTIAEAMGVEVPPSFAGRSLLPAIWGGELGARPAFGELLPAPSWNHDAKMMVEGDDKIIYWISARRWEVYDLATDPEERRNLAASDPEKRSHLESQLARWIEVDLQQ